MPAEAVMIKTIPGLPVGDMSKQWLLKDINVLPAQFPEEYARAYGKTEIIVPMWKIWVL